MKHFLIALIAAFALSSPALSGPVRIKDLVNFDGVRDNDLVGYGLVVGLNGTGDGLRNAPFTEDIMTNILERLGVNVTGEQFRPKNVAAVFVTSTLPAFARTGNQIDVTVSAIGDAKSLMGGTLVMTPLNAADGEIYAVAQGTIIAGGVVAQGDAGQVTQGVPTSGVIPSGARVEREIEFQLASLMNLRIALREADFTTASRIEAAINKSFGTRVAVMLDSGTVQLSIGETKMGSVAHALGRIENIKVEPERKARVVVDQRSGTIVMGEDVRISRVAVSQGNLTVRIQDDPIVVQPNPFAEGETLVVPRTRADIQEEPGIGLGVQSRHLVDWV